MGKSQRTIQHSPKQSWIQRIAGRNHGEKGTGHSLKSLPSFFIVGPPRTGTSWLHEVLREHAVLPIATKETRFFDTHFHRGLEWYLAHFPPPTTGYRVGEVAPTYFASLEARARIAELLPAARIVCIFRNPVERIVSLYRVKRAYGLIPWTLEEAIAEDPEFLSTSRYTENYRAWQSALGTDQVLATLYDDLCADPQSYLDRLVDFVGVPRFTLAPAQRNSVHASDHLTHPRSYTCTRNATQLANWLKAQRFDKLVATIRNSPIRRFFLGGGPPFTPPTDDLTKHLYEHFAPEVEKLEEALRRSLQEWKWARRPAPSPAATTGDTLSCGASTPDPNAADRAIA